MTNDMHEAIGMALVGLRRAIARRRRHRYEARLHRAIAAGTPRAVPVDPPQAILELLPRELGVLDEWGRFEWPQDLPASPLAARAAHVSRRGKVTWDPSFEEQGPELPELFSLGRSRLGALAREAQERLERLLATEVDEPTARLLQDAFEAIQTAAWAREHPRDAARRLLDLRANGLELVLWRQPPSTREAVLLCIVGPPDNPSHVELRLRARDADACWPLPAAVGRHVIRRLWEAIG
jgi:hypothetical protein